MGVLNLSHNERVKFDPVLRLGVQKVLDPQFFHFVLPPSL